MSWYNPRTWGNAQSVTKRSAFHEAKDRSWNEILQLMYSNSVASGENVTPANAMRCSTVHAIVRAMSNAIGSYPIGVFRELMDDDGKPTYEPITSHPALPLLKRPNSRMSQGLYYRRVSVHMLLWGNHVSIKGQGGQDRPQMLRPVHPDTVTVLENDEINPLYQITFQNDVRRYRAAQLVHVTNGISVDGAWAESPVTLAAEPIGLALAAERLLAELYGNSSVPSILLTGGNWSSEEQYDLFIQKFKSVYGRGGSKAGGTAMLPEGMDAKEITFKPIDAQLLEARKFQRTEIASVWGVPPHKLADLERATFANIEHQGLEFLQDVMLPHARLIEEALERDVLTEEDRARNVVIRFDLDGAERADFKSRVDGYKGLYEVGAINPNQIRAREGMRPRKDEGGEAYVTPLNMRTSDDDTGSTNSNGASDTEASGGDSDTEV